MFWNILLDMYIFFYYFKAIGGKVKERCLIVFMHESLLFTECQNLISFKSYYNFNFGNLVRSLIDFWTKMKFYDILCKTINWFKIGTILVQNYWNFHKMAITCGGTKLKSIFGKFWIQPVLCYSAKFSRKMLNFAYFCQFAAHY